MKLESRKFIIIGIFIVFSVFLLVRLYNIQVKDNSYKDLADSNYIHKKTTYPARGLIYDTSGKLLVDNQPVYDLMVIPRNVKKDMDTMRLCELFNISKKEFKENLIKARNYSSRKPSIFLKQISPIMYGKASEYLYLFPGFFTQRRTIRSYHTRGAPHVYGYLGEVDQQKLENDEYYDLGDYIGQSGVERSYEKILRGIKGEEYVTVDAYNREKESYKGGSEDLPAKQGTDLQLTIDIDLQEYAEKLMVNKIGSVIAIDPSNGDILTMVSSPSYDPSLLTGRERGANMKALNNDPLKRQLNRCITATYPPGSTLKPFIALIGLQEGVIHKNSYIKCGGAFYYAASSAVKCSHGHSSCPNIYCAVEQSCNPYFCEVFKRSIANKKYGDVEQSLQQWINYLEEFGLGAPLDIGLPGMVAGTMPSVEYYNKIHNNEYWHWKWTTIISLGIGQGEFAITPMHLANAVSILANRGVYHYPHLVKNVEQRTPTTLSIERRHFDTLADAMEQVMISGTGRYSAVEGIDICGKTGTAENPHGDDHSIFVSFAPKVNPKIAIAAVIENSGYGSTYAAPISTLMIEQYLNDTISKHSKRREKKMFEANLIDKDKEE